MNERAESSIRKENSKLRTLLKEVLALDTRKVTVAEFDALKAKVAASIAEMDGRTGKAGFANEGVKAKATQTHATRRERFQREHGATLRKLAGEGLSSSAIAHRLNEMGIKAPMGGSWAAGSVDYQIKVLPPQK